MITDNECNFLYLSDLLNHYKIFSTDFFSLLSKYKISYDFLPNTKDVWCRDFMPIQVSETEYVKFVYNPGYLQYNGYKQSITDNKQVSESLSIKYSESDIVLDGGNVIKGKNKAILSDRIFRENKHVNKNSVSEIIKAFFRVDDLLIIPSDPDDEFGHADSMLRFVNDELVVVSDYSKLGMSKHWLNKFYGVLGSHGLNMIHLPYPTETNPSLQNHSAVGAYINFLLMQDILFFPVFELKEDITAYEIIKKLYNVKVVPINCNEIAKDGGVLNCISWTIKV